MVSSHIGGKAKELSEIMNLRMNWECVIHHQIYHNVAMQPVPISVSKINNSQSSDKDETRCRLSLLV